MGSEIIDQTRLDAVRNLQQPGLLNKIITLYMDDAPQRVENIRRAVEASDSESLRRAAHALKSSSANLGAVRFSGLCAALEKMGRDGSLDGVSALAEEMRLEHEQVMAALDAERLSESA